jgi:hypothetical protein
MKFSKMGKENSTITNISNLTIERKFVSQGVCLHWMSWRPLLESMFDAKLHASHAAQPACINKFKTAADRAADRPGTNGIGAK